jgi:hypothetical protein
VKTVLRTVVALSVAAVLTIGGRAEDKKKAAPKKDPYAGFFSFSKMVASKLALTNDQKAKLNDLRKEYTPKLEEADAKISKIMTPERRKAAADAAKEAKAAGKKGKDLAAAVQAALKLSQEEQDQLKQANQARGKLVSEIVKKKMALLTDEQKALLRPKPKDKNK